MTDNVNHPSHYAEGWSNGAEVIDITENLNFNRGNAVKYIARAGKKDPCKELEDLRKAEFYLKREIDRLTPSFAVENKVPNGHIGGFTGGGGNEILRREIDWAVRIGTYDVDEEGEWVG